MTKHDHAKARIAARAKRNGTSVQREQSQTPALHVPSSQRQTDDLPEVLPLDIQRDGDRTDWDTLNLSIRCDDLGLRDAFPLPDCDEYYLTLFIDFIDTLTLLRRSDGRPVAADDSMTGIDAYSQNFPVGHRRATGKMTTWTEQASDRVHERILLWPDLEERVHRAVSAGQRAIRFSATRNHVAQATQVTISVPPLLRTPSWPGGSFISRASNCGDANCEREMFLIPSDGNVLEEFIAHRYTWDFTDAHVFDGYDESGPLVKTDIVVQRALPDEALIALRAAEYNAAVMSFVSRVAQVQFLQAVVGFIPLESDLAEAAALTSMRVRLTQHDDFNDFDEEDD